MASRLTVYPAARAALGGRLLCGGRLLPCALGKGGLRHDKREGDGASPIGTWPLRRVLYRPDRLGSAPRTALLCQALTPADGWCDDPAFPALYNRPVVLPFAGSHERLWREDGLYDVIVVLGHNDAPPVPGRGSAIFLHVARPGFAPTEGCVALSLADLLWVVHHCDPTTVLDIGTGGPSGEPS